MKVLAIDTSGQVAAVAIMDEQLLIAEYTIHRDKTHSQMLMPMIEVVMKDSGLNSFDMDAFAVSNGPGSFTGLRIGVATIKALAHATQKPVIAVPTLEALAFNMVGYSGFVCPIMDARRGQAYNAVCHMHDATYELIAPSRAVDIEQVIAEIKQHNQKTIFLGDGVPVFGDQIKQQLGELASFAPPALCMQRAASVAALAIMRFNNNQTLNYSALVPEYLRKSQAERELDLKNVK
ncbi:MAG: tRNA (adenosine(37)-N6)-threonylcarbamoyltransferase complex dimerization subunit type 1 TsaB [Hyphomonadaceae bacterium]|nr:tRNA (adenosine(37)-N6)-threonylcarbamoyltransferase complex dimerization subunit type 1 TsaB [Clostridia bacterium]